MGSSSPRWNFRYGQLRLSSELRDGFKTLFYLYFLGLTLPDLGRMSESLSTLNEAMQMGRHKGDRNQSLKIPTPSDYSPRDWRFRSINPITPKPFSKLYLGLPETPSQASQSDFRLAYNLYQWKIGLEIIEAALLLASVRRLFRDHALPRLSAIRSLHYLLPALSEIAANPLPQGYIHYHRCKLESNATRDRVSK